MKALDIFIKTVVNFAIGFWVRFTVILECAKRGSSCEDGCRFLDKGLLSARGLVG